MGTHISAAAASTTLAGGQALLLVDDEPELRQILAEGLEMSGYHVVQAATAEDALHIAMGRDDLSLAISDVRLPGMSGVDLAERLAMPDCKLATILISGYFLPQTIRFRLLQKPFTLRELEAAIVFELRDQPRPIDARSKLDP